MFLIDYSHYIILTTFDEMEEMVVRILAKNGMCLGHIYKSGIKMGPYTFDCIEDHKKFVHNVYGNVEESMVKYNNIDFMPYYQARNIGDVLLTIQQVNSRNIDSEIMKALRNLKDYDSSDVSRRLIKIANDIKDVE